MAHVGDSVGRRGFRCVDPDAFSDEFPGLEVDQCRLHSRAANIDTACHRRHLVLQEKKLGCDENNNPSSVKGGAGSIICAPRRMICSLYRRRALYGHRANSKEGETDHERKTGPERATRLEKTEGMPSSQVRHSRVGDIRSRMDPFSAENSWPCAPSRRRLEDLRGCGEIPAPQAFGVLGQRGCGDSPAPQAFGVLRQRGCGESPAPQTFGVLVHTGDESMPGAPSCVFGSAEAVSLCWERTTAQASRIPTLSWWSITAG